MGKSSKKSINTNRPARRARRGAAATEAVAAVTPAADAVTPAADDVTPVAATELATEAPPVAEAAPAAPRHEVQQLAFSYYAESGYENGHALDHWLRAEHELAGS